MKPPDSIASIQPWLDVDRLVHEPARLVILTILNASESAEFKFLEAMTGLTRGNLSSHTAKLQMPTTFILPSGFGARCHPRRIE